MAHEKRPDGYQVHLGNRWSVLLWINRFGGLTTRQLARLIWTNQDCGMRSAQRIVASLLADKLVIKRSLPSGGTIYVLSVSGARVLQCEGATHVSARGHRDLTFHKPLHRVIANDYAIDMHLEGWRIWTEFEIQRRLAPVPRIVIKPAKTHPVKPLNTEQKYLPKIPDLIIGLEGDLVWVEVENAFKSQARLSEIVSVARRLFKEDSGYRFQNEYGCGFYTSMSFVSSNPDRLYAVFRCLLDHHKEDKICYEMLQKIDLIRVHMSSGLVWGGVVRAHSASKLFNEANALHEIKTALQDLFDRDGVSFTAQDKGFLWRLYVRVAEILRIPLNELEQALGMEVSEYEELNNVPQDVFDRLDEERILSFLENTRDEWMEKNTDFKKSDFMKLFSAYDQDS